MRLDAWILGSAACLMAGAAKASSSSGELLRRSGSQANTRIRFEPFTKPNIFTSEVTIPWTVADNTLTVMTAQLRLMNNNKLVAVGERSMNSGRSPAAGDSNQHRNGGRSEDVPAHQRALSDSVFKIPFDTSKTAGSVTLLVDDQKDDYTNNDVFNQPLFLEVWWTNSTGGVGQSSTPFFAVTNLTATDASYQDLQTQISGLVSDDELPAQNEGTASISATTTQTGGVAPATAGATGTPATIAATTGASTATETPTAGATGSAAGSSSSSSGSGGGSTGLSTGAVAGIAVACGVLGLALIGAAVWFLCFRRRRRSDHTALGQYPGGYASDGAAAMMDDAKMPHVSADSPRSTYASDRGQLSHDLPPIGSGGGGGMDPHRNSMAMGTAAAAGAGAAAGVGTNAAHHDDDVPYAPYSDRAPTSPESMSQTDLVAGGGVSGTRSPTPPISTRYAHLIEEGMTEDEIRRLDEEERQLDAAIEVAGRSSRAA